MKNLSSLINLATAAARLVAMGKQAIESFRAVVATEHPDSLEAFDAAVAAARKPWQEAANAAQAEEGTNGKA
jgi:hypothetical protein